MEAVLTFIAVATMLGVPTMVVLLLRVILELSTKDLTQELLAEQRQFIFDKPFSVACWFGVISALTLVVGLFVTGDPVAFTDVVAWIWIVLIVTCILAARILEKRIARMKHTSNLHQGGGGIG